MAGIQYLVSGILNFGFINMCGIVAYLGHRHNASKLVFDGLKTMEYRGYDSWGIASLTPNLSVIKQVGKISDFTDADSFPSDSAALGHTRWATHGAVTKKNAHPHFSQSKRLVIAHNGIVENYDSLKNHLTQAGVKFFTETDTEVIANLVERHLLRGRPAEEATRLALNQIVGRNAFVIYDRREQLLIGARNGSPLILGLGDNEFFLASDSSPFLAYTKQVIILDNQEVVTVNRRGFRISAAKTGRQVNRPVQKLKFISQETTKGDFPHFYLKETYEQPEVIQRAINQPASQLKTVLRMIRQAKSVYLTGAGTAGRVAMIGTYLLAKIGRLKTWSLVSSELPHFAHLLGNQDLLIAISQSGETADTLEAIGAARQKGVKIVSIVNVASSSMVRESDQVFLMKAGPERAVASTKATTSPIAILTLLAYSLANKPGEGRKMLTQVADGVSRILQPKNVKFIQSLAGNLYRQENLYIIGRGLSYPIALEGAVKLQELPYIHAEGIAGAELKHYAITLIEKNTPCLVLAPNDATRDLILSNAVEVAARGGRIIGIGPQSHPVFANYFEVADLGEFASPILSLVPMQLLAYYLTLKRGFDPDYCRNLAKSVTVK